MNITPEISIDLGIRYSSINIGDNGHVKIITKSKDDFVVVKETKNIEVDENKLQTIKSAIKEKIKSNIQVEYKGEIKMLKSVQLLLNK
jgi:hypothetical protein